MRRERHAWGSSRVFYSIQGIRRECGTNFHVTVWRHSREQEQKTLVICPSRYTAFLDLVNTHTNTRFKLSRRAYDKALRPLERFIAEHELRATEQ